MQKVTKIFFLVFLIFFCIIIATGIYIIVTISKIDNLEALNLDGMNLLNTQIQIYDNEENQILTASATGQQTTNLAELPNYVGDAFVSIEDKTFYSHNGLNYVRIAKAGVKNMLSGYAKEGASTITQQLIKNIYLTNEKTLSRKVQEAYLAIKLEQKYPKEKILETYLNVIYFGNGAFGIENAARSFFDKPARELTLAESATLAGIIKSPKTYSPTQNKEKCLERRNLVLKNMLEDKKIDEAEYASALAEPINVSENDFNADILKEIFDEATQKLNLSERDISSAGYKIYTTLDSRLLKNVIALKSADKENIVMVIDNKTGAIIAGFGNMSIRRHPASTIKPFICYAPGFERGILSPATPLDDSITNFNGYMPKNANGKYIGWTDVRNSLSKSLNIPAVKALEYVGLDNAVNDANKLDFGLSSDDKNLALALGATKSGISIKTVANAYATLARLGSKTELSMISHITDSFGNELYRHSPTAVKVLSPESAYLINDILKDSVTNGTARKLQQLELPAMRAKTGTAGTKDAKNTDAWCISYTPEFTVLSWYGNSQGDHSLDLEKSENGGTISASQNVKIWQELKKFYEVKADFARPKGVVEVAIDTLSLEKQKLELAGENTPECYQKLELFNERFVPKTVSLNFDKIEPPTLELQKSEDKLNLSWQGNKLYRYTLFCESAAGVNKLKIIDGTDSEMIETLKLPTTTIAYWVEVEYRLNSGKSSVSNKVKYYCAPTLESSPASAKNTKSDFFSWLKDKIKKPQ